jgi:CheY-like chemotaxis protein
MPDKKKLLLVDDDEAVISYLTAKLGKYFEIVSTSEPLMAVTLAAHEHPDAILCDIDMPEMNGGDVAKALEADTRTARIPLVYLTALMSPDEAKDLQGRVGGRPGVAKRAPMAELLAVIESVTAAR